MKEPTFSAKDKDNILNCTKRNIFEKINPYLQKRINKMVDTHNLLMNSGSSIWTVYVGIDHFTKVDMGSCTPQLGYTRSDNLHESLHDEAKEIHELKQVRDILHRRFDIYLTRCLNQANFLPDVEALTPRFLKKHLWLPKKLSGKECEAKLLTKTEIENFELQNQNYYNDLKEQYLSIMLLSGLD